MPGSPRRSCLLSAMIVLGLGNGCATVMSGGVANGPSADAQRLAADSIEKGLQPLRELVRGKPVSVRLVASPAGDAPGPLALYAGDCVRELISTEGGRLVPDAEGDVKLEIFAVRGGMNATERNLMVPIGQNVRIPLIYAEGLVGESGVIVVARDPAGNPIPRKAVGGRSGETEYYLFRFLGPFRR